MGKGSAVAGLGEAVGLAVAGLVVGGTEAETEMAVAGLAAAEEEGLVEAVLELCRHSTSHQAQYPVVPAKSM